MTRSRTDVLAIEGAASATRSRGRKIAIAIIAPLFAFVALLCWGYSSPVGSSPDDDYHLTSIWCGNPLNDEYCGATSQDDERIVPLALLKASQCFAFDAAHSANCALPSIDVETQTDRGNFDGGYPPLFYSTMSVFAGSNIGVSVLLMRGFNSALFVGLVSALFFLTPVGRRGPLIWGALATIVPLGMFLIPSVNPSSWAVISAVVLGFSLLQMFRETERSRQIIFASFAALATLIGAGARSDSAVYSVIAMGAVLILRFTPSKKFLLLCIPLVVLSVVAVMFFFSGGQSAVVNPDGYTPSATLDTGGLIAANLIELPLLWVGVFGSGGLGSLGWLDTRLPSTVWVPVLLVFSALVFSGLKAMTRRKAVVLGLVGFSLILIPMYIFVHDGVLIGAFVQPRYIYPLIVLFAIIALTGAGLDGFDLNRLQWGVIVTLLAVSNSIALHTNIRRYVTGVDNGGLNLDNGAEWWWGFGPSPMMIWAVGSIAFLVVLIAAARYSLRTDLRIGLSSKVSGDLGQFSDTPVGRSAVT